MAEDFWAYLKRSLQCKPSPSEVHDPSAISQERISHRNSNNNNNGGFGIGGCCPCDPLNDIGDNKRVLDSHRSTRPKTTTPSRKTHHEVDCNECNNIASSSNSKRVMMHTASDNNDPQTLICPMCHEELEGVDVEAHHFDKHSVIELSKEDSSSQIIETICRTGNWSDESERMLGQVESVLKVQNLPTTFSRFEEYREMVKLNADKSQKKQPRCVADGNELLRFHGTTITCSLGTNRSSGLCTSRYCNVCQILRHGSYTNKEFHGSFGIFTTSTCGKAFESIDSSAFDNMRYSHRQRKCVIVCRVIAGRILHCPLDDHEIIEESGNDGFDSLAEKRSNSNSEIDEELYVLNPSAILPCFVVIFRPGV